MKLVGVGISSRACVERYPDFLEDFLCALDSALELPGMRHHEIHDEGALSLLSEDVVEVDVLLVVRIAHGPAPELFLCGGELGPTGTPLMDRAEDVEPKREKGEDRARIAAPETRQA